MPIYKVRVLTKSVNTGGECYEFHKYGVNKGLNPVKVISRKIGLKNQFEHRCEIRHNRKQTGHRYHRLKYKFIEIIGAAKGEGIDQWGTFYDLSGHEAEGYCFWCGKPVLRQRYCCKEHQEFYLKHYSWREATFFCYERYNNQCADCGKTDDLRVHHIIPLNGDLRTWNYLNRPENLVLLCQNCHIKRHIELNYLLKKVDIVNHKVDIVNHVVDKQQDQIMLF